jgi:hypothetical protein
VITPSRPNYLPLLVTDLEKFLKTFPGAQKLSSGVGVFGTAEAYALVWELGSRRLLKYGPVPKTLWSTNRLGEQAILTKQAPKGYVGINAKKAKKIFKEELAKVKINMQNMNLSKLRLEIALDNAALRLARIISDSAPVDSGDLRSQIQSISTDEMDDFDDDQGILFL